MNPAWINFCKYSKCLISLRQKLWNVFFRSLSVICKHQVGCVVIGFLVAGQIWVTCGRGTWRTCPAGSSRGSPALSSASSEPTCEEASAPRETLTASTLRLTVCFSAAVSCLMSRPVTWTWNRGWRPPSPSAPSSPRTGKQAVNHSSQRRAAQAHLLNPNNSTTFKSIRSKHVNY